MAGPSGNGSPSSANPPPLREGVVPEEMPNKAEFEKVGPIKSRALGGPMHLQSFIQQKWLSLTIEERCRWLTVYDTRIIDRLFSLMRRICLDPAAAHDYDHDKHIMLSVMILD